MKLYIKEIAWGIDRMNGGSKERVTAEVSFPCVVGAVPEFGRGGRSFFIESVTEDEIVLAVHYENNPSADKSWTIQKGDSQFYMPRSFDGGYKYNFTVK